MPNWKKVITSGSQAELAGVTGSFTGSFIGDGSGLTGISGGGGGGIFAATGSIQSTTNDLQITGSVQIYKSGSTVFNIEGSQGQLFSVTDELSGSLFSVNDISGIPIFEVFSDDTIIAGAYNQNDFVITDSKIGIGKDSPTSKLDMSGSLTVTGSVKTEVVALSVASNTASMDCTLSNSFTLDLVAGTDTYLNPTNIQPGQSLNLKITQNDTEVGTLSYGSDIKFSNTLPYTASATLEAIDIVSFASFDSTTLYASALKDFN